MKTLHWSENESKEAHKCELKVETLHGNTYSQKQTEKRLRTRIQNVASHDNRGIYLLVIFY